MAAFDFLTCFILSFDFNLGFGWVEKKTPMAHAHPYMYITHIWEKSCCATKVSSQLVENFPLFCFSWKIYDALK